MKTIKEYLLEVYEMEDLKNIVEEGCVNGCATQHIYCKDTIAFYDKFKDEIWKMLNVDAENMGSTPLGFINSFVRASNVMCDTSFKSLLCWYAIESESYKIVNEEEK